MKSPINRVGLALLLAAWNCVAAAPAAVTLTRLTAEPAQVVLGNADQYVQLLVTAHLSDGSERDVTHAAGCSVTVQKNAATTSAIVAINAGRIVPRADGATSIEVVFQDSATKQTLRAAVPVQVTGFAVERRLNYAKDILPILTKAGCNSGGCHGKQGGQNGFAPVPVGL